MTISQNFATQKYCTSPCPPYSSHPTIQFMSFKFHKPSLCSKLGEGDTLNFLYIHRLGLFFFLGGGRGGGVEVLNFNIFFQNNEYFGGMTIF